MKKFLELSLAGSMAKLPEENSRIICFRTLSRVFPEEIPVTVYEWIPGESIPGDTTEDTPGNMTK